MFRVNVSKRDRLFWDKQRERERESERERERDRERELGLL